MNTKELISVKNLIIDEGIAASSSSFITALHQIPKKALLNLFKSNVENDKGCYLIKFYKPNRDEFAVIIDDRVPFSIHSGLLFGSSKDQLWVSLVQKAFAKVCGSYSNARQATF